MSAITMNPTLYAVCPNNTVAEPEPAQQYSPTYGTGTT